MPTPESFRFSSTKSFQLFTQGLQSLQSYERDANFVKLQDAAGNFSECVRRFPNDVLPHFYYGIVKTLEGYDGLDEAIEQFNLVLRSKADDLIPDAKYNLAVAHLEKYTTQDTKIALNLLRQTGDEVAKRKESKAATDSRLETIRLQALILEVYLYIQEHLSFAPTAPSEASFVEVEKSLNEFFQQLNRADVSEPTRHDLLADYYNDWGSYLEERANHSEGAQKASFVEQARLNYEQALEHKKDWIPVKSNLARLYDVLLNDRSTATRLCLEVLETRPSDYYALYLLGNIYKKDGDTLRAIASYKKAGTKIPEANLKLGRIYMDLGAYDNAIVYLERALNDPKASERSRDGAKQTLASVLELQKLSNLDPTTPA
jgi:tetratricopeptide (TPR) repeat protein